MNPIPHGTAQIRAASEADLPAIHALAAVIWRACYPGIISASQIEYMLARMYSLDVLRREICAEAIRYERLLAADEFIGFGSYGPAQRPGVFKLHKLYVHPEHHGRGLGSMLLQHCEARARLLGARRLELNVNKLNTKAIAAYRRNGFSISDSVKTDIGGGFVMDDYVMTTDLAE